MKEILFLCHRIPYPPNKGDKIRAFHLLRALADDYTVHLGTFVDDADDWQHRHALDEMCAETCYRPLSSLRARVRSLTGFLTNEPLSFPYYRDAKLQQWVNQTMRERPIDAIVVFSSTMAPYVTDYEHVRRVLDFVDVDSEKWRQYAPTAGIPMRWIYAREGQKLLAAERNLAASFDVSVFVSEAEAKLFRERAPECADATVSVPNGVDSAYFDPDLGYADPYDGNGNNTCVFIGAMDYRANIDAVVWFAREVWPLVREQRPSMIFYIVGARPAREVQELARQPGIEVTGTVADVRPYLAHAALAVAPLRIARGLQNKVLEALSMGKRVVLTPEAAAGLKPLDPQYAAIESEPVALAQKIAQFLENNAKFERNTPSPLAGEGRGEGKSNTPRNYVLQHYSWGTQLKQFMSLIEGAHPATNKPTLAPELLAEDSA